MQFTCLSTLALLALAGVAFQAATAVPTHQPAADPKSPASSQEQVSSDTGAAQVLTAAKQPGAQDLTGSVTQPQPGQVKTNAAATAFDPSTMRRTTPSLLGFASDAPEIFHAILRNTSKNTSAAVSLVSKKFHEGAEGYQAEREARAKSLGECLPGKWTALLASDAVKELQAAVRAATGIGERRAATTALLDALLADETWTECLTEADPEATVKECPHRDYQLVGNNGEYTPPPGAGWYKGLELAQDKSARAVSDRAHATQLCKLAENDAFYWLEQLAKDAPGYFRGAGLHALIHIVQLTKDKLTAKSVQAIVQRFSAPSGPIWLRGYYDPVVEHYLFNRGPSLLSKAWLGTEQLLSGILARALAISKRPLAYLAPWYKADEPTELDMPHVQLPVADRMAVMRHVGESVDRTVLRERYFVPYENTFPVIEQPGPGDAYQFLTLPDQSQRANGLLVYKNTMQRVHPFDLVAGYYTADEAFEFYYAAYKDTYYPSAIVMAARSTDETKLLDHVFAHQVGEPGTNFLELPHVASYMREPKGQGHVRGESEAWERLGEAVMDCSKVCSKDRWPTFKKLMVERLSTLTPAQMDRFETSVQSSGALYLLKENPAVTELPDDQCTTFAQRYDCAAHRVASLLRQGKSAVQAK